MAALWRGQNVNRSSEEPGVAAFMFGVFWSVVAIAGKG